MATDETYESLYIRKDMEIIINSKWNTKWSSYELRKGHSLNFVVNQDVFLLCISFPFIQLCFLVDIYLLSRFLRRIYVTLIPTMLTSLKRRCSRSSAYIPLWLLPRKTQQIGTVTTYEKCVYIRAYKQALFFIKLNKIFLKKN